MSTPRGFAPIQPRAGLESGDSNLRMRRSNYVFATRSRTRLGLGIARVAIASLSVVSLLVAFDLAFLGLITDVPLDARRLIPPPYDRLAETTKQGSIPKDFIAIIGDSYAYGLGDWVLKVLDSRGWSVGEPFDSAGVIHDAASADVLSLGTAGFGSIRGIALGPVVSLRLLSARFHVEPPRLFLVYFYEGNDLSDNLDELRSLEPPPLSGTLSKNDLLSLRLGTLASSEVHRSDTGRFLGFKFLIALSRNAWERMRGRGEPIPELPLTPPSDVYNRTRFANGTTALPDRLDGPALELSPDETHVAVEVFQRSLSFLVSSFPQSRVAVVYIPAVLSCYSFEGIVSAHTAWSRPNVYPASMVAPRSDRIARSIRAAAEQTGAAFIDPRRALRRAAAQAPIHGPRDWRHFNRLGYETLGHVIVDWLHEIEWPLLTRFSSDTNQGA